MKSSIRCSAFAFALALTACSGGSDSSGSSGTGELVIEVTDAPPDYSQIAVARIDVSEVKVHESATANSGWMTLYSGPTITFDLLDLQNGVKSLLVRADVPAGSYRQVRLVIPSAHLELTDGDVFSTAAGNLELTSLDTSGLKIFVNPPIVVTSGLSRTLLLDFDLTKTFHPVPANDPFNANKYLLKPVVKASNLSDSGEIRGTVRDSSGAGVAQASVYVLPPGEIDPANSVATTGTADDGHYALLGIAPGTYDVIATKGALMGTALGKSVSVANTTTVDIVIQ